VYLEPDIRLLPAGMSLGIVDLTGATFMFASLWVTRRTMAASR
jgi:hypothetical protein